jgi:hypothetical protein
MMPPGLHSAISPSKLHRYLKCPAAFTLESTLPEGPSSPQAQEGTMLHDLTERAIYEYLPKYVLPTSSEMAEFLKCDIEHANLVHSCYEELLNVYEPHMEWLVEHTVHLTYYAALLVQCSGTPDVVLIDRLNKNLYVIDWKFGSFGPILVRDNPQLLAYAAGALTLLPKQMLGYSVQMIIAQPRLNHLDKTTMHARAIDQWVHYTLIPGVQTILDSKAEVRPGAPQCDWCRFAVKCRGLKEFRLKQAQRLFSLPLEQLTESELIGAYREAEYVKSLAASAITRILDFVFDIKDKGGDIAGFKVVRGRGKQEWMLPEVELVNILAEHVDISTLYDPRFMSPAQAKKRLPKEVYEIIQKYIKKKPGAPKISAEPEESTNIEL